MVSCVLRMDFSILMRVEGRRKWFVFGIIGHVLKGCCPVSLLHCGLWSIRPRGDGSDGNCNSFRVSGGHDFFVSVSGTAASAFCMPELALGGASTTLVGAVVFIVSETFDASLVRLARFVGHV